MSGRFLPCGRQAEHAASVPDHELIRRVAETTGLSHGEAARVIDDVLAWHSESVEDFVRRRHRHHQTYGKRNDEIFALLRMELQVSRFVAPKLSERQLRRIVYG